MLNMPRVQGIIDRRMLINFRVTPQVAQALLPRPFRPKLVRGWAIVGICLIRLKHLRPQGLPRAFGVTSENAAHRIAVEWEDRGELREGVFIPRRDTAQRLNVLLGGRVFPGVHHLATLDVRESAGDFQLRMRSHDGDASLSVDATIADRLAEGSIFTTLKEASDFFEGGAAGYSPARKTGILEGLELKSHAWAMTPLHVRSIESSFFSNRTRFPAGSMAFDNALLMRGIEHEWLRPPILRTGVANAL
ncbi:MAG TPA: DUF2071 domain-containing protein [Verrucomicrobiae bacterium]|nr:DUF2071 domain-containing protein [Verrucomicrobiae bacterium]